MDGCVKDELNLHVSVEIYFPYRVTKIVDPSITSGDERGKEITCFVRVACSLEIPTGRMKMVDVITGLQNLKGIYQNRQQIRNIKDPSTSQFANLTTSITLF
ncbi:conserved hypothetical protein [Ricinus communis]|uniref:Uncharacterized protein n=1 Tax=Ricinus communis TaxID=3988 RepID=B9SBW8_RICCO|nr:conserved hypothetical protein [Ricinus communis]